jgi:prevent-host-death family protein
MARDRKLERMLMKSIQARDAQSHLWELLERVAVGEWVLIQRHEHPVAVLISASELERLDRMAHMARHMALTAGQNEALLDQIERGEVHPAMAAFGLWRDEPDLATLADEVMHNRDQQPSRPGADM